MTEKQLKDLTLRDPHEVENHRHCATREYGGKKYTYKGTCFEPAIPLQYHSA